MNNKPKIALLHAEHNQNPVVKIVYDFNEEINELLKKTTPAKWSNTMNCWYILRDEFNLNQFFKLNHPLTIWKCRKLLLLILQLRMKKLYIYNKNGWLGKENFTYKQVTSKCKTTKIDQMTRHTITLILMLLSLCLFGQTKDTTSRNIQVSNSTNDSLTVIKSDSLKITLNLTDIDKIEKLFLKKEPSWFTTYGTLIVAFLALAGALVTSILNNRRSRINTDQQINAAAENISRQLTAFINLEKEKKKLELAFKLKTELKENVAKFIQKATALNSKLTPIIYSDIAEGRTLEAQENYNNTYALRQELRDIYYSIKVTVDDSESQRVLVFLLGYYMNEVDFNFDINRTPQQEHYEDSIKKLYDIIKSIIHENYQE